jgi:hypothetical protein
MTATAKQELYDLAEQAREDQESPRQPLSKDDVVSAIHEYDISKQKSQETAQQEQRQRDIEQRRNEEKQELLEISETVKASLKEEMTKDKDFAKLVQNTDLPGNLVEYIAEIGEAEEAPLIIRELANNEEYQQTLKRSKTAVGIKRLISKVRKDVLTGGSQGDIPPMLKKNIPNYNPNTTTLDYDQDFYSDLAMRHGI